MTGDDNLDGLFESAIKQENQAVDLTTVKVEEDGGRRVAVIRTSDRNSFRHCRRKWAWGSHLRGNMGPKQNASPLWFGSGFHFALEDYHGYKKFPTAYAALEAYAQATLKQNAEALPDDWKEHMVMGKTMLDYYEVWWERHKLSIPDTYIVDGIPQNEVNFRIPIPMDPELLKSYGYDEAVYSGTIDAVRYDKESGLLWILDYKTAKMFQTAHYRHDPQVTAYCWAAAHMYDKPIGGMIYQQHLKKEITGPKVLKSGHLSSAKNQITSHILYKQAMIDIYGSVDGAPADIIEHLNRLAAEEDERYDRFVRLDYLSRNDHIQQAEGVKIVLETADMLNPNLPLYPSPGRDCTYMCSFNSVCTSFDDGSDWEAEMEADFALRAKEYDGWRTHLIYPGDPVPEGMEDYSWD